MKVTIYKDEGKLKEQSREMFKEWFKSLKNGCYLVEAKKIVNSYTPTRYKYYFDCVLWMILEAAGNNFQIFLPNGERKTISNTTDLHGFFKHKYNSVSVLDQLTGEVIKMPLSTTGLSDRKFIGEYMESIIMDYSGSPFFIEFPAYEEWKEMHKAGRWNRYKNKFLTTV